MRIQRYESPMVAPAITPGGYLQTPAGDGGMQALGAGLSAAAMGAHEIIQEANVTRTKDQLNQFMDEVNALQLGAGKVLGGNVFQMGKDGKTPLLQAATQDYDAAVQRHIEKLGNDDQKRMFRENADRLRASFREGVGKHESDQAFKYQVSVEEGQLGKARERMASEVAAGVASEASILQNLAMAVDASDRLSRLAGLPENVAAESRRTALGQVHAIVANGMIEKGDYTAAGDYLEKNKAEIPAEVRHKFDPIIKEGRDYAWSVKAADDLVRKHMIPGSSNFDAAAAHEAGRAMAGDNKRRADALSDELNRRFQEMRVASDAKSDAYNNGIYQLFTQTGSVNAVKQSPEFRQLLALDGQKAASTLHTIEAWAKQRAEGGPSDWLGSLKNYMTLMQDPEKLKNMNMTELFQYAKPLGQSLFGRALGTWQDLRGPEGLQKLAKVKLENEVLTSFANKAGVALKDRAAMADFQIAFEDAVASAQVLKKAPLSRQELNDIGKQMAAEVVVKPGFFSKTMRGWQLQREDLAEMEASLNPLELENAEIQLAKSGAIPWRKVGVQRSAAENAKIRRAAMEARLKGQK